MDRMSLVRQKIHTTLRREAAAGPTSLSSSCHSLSSLNKDTGPVLHISPGKDTPLTPPAIIGSGAVYTNLSFTVIHTASIS